MGQLRSGPDLVERGLGYAVHYCHCSCPSPGPNPPSARLCGTVTQDGLLILPTFSSFLSFSLELSVCHQSHLALHCLSLFEKLILMHYLKVSRSGSRFDDTAPLHQTKRPVSPEWKYCFRTFWPQVKMEWASYRTWLTYQGLTKSYQWVQTS